MSTTPALCFAQKREWLEARFISVLNRVDPIEGQRWESAHWHDEVLWARDRQTRDLLALSLRPFRARAIRATLEPRHATVLFEFRKGHWCAEGKRLDEMRPDEAIGGNRRFEASSSPIPVTRAGSAEHSRCLGRKWAGLCQAQERSPRGDRARPFVQLWSPPDSSRTMRRRTSGRRRRASASCPGSRAGCRCRRSPGSCRA